MVSAGHHIFADETKARMYVMAAVSLPQSELGSAYKELRALRVGGQRALHFKNENPRRRRAILALLADQGWIARIVQSSAHREHEARPECLAKIMDFAKEIGALQLTIELDDSVIQRDHRELFSMTRNRDLPAEFRYEVTPRSEAPGLWAADAVAWSFARGGEWRQRIERLLDE